MKTMKNLYLDLSSYIYIKKKEFAFEDLMCKLRIKIFSSKKKFCFYLHKYYLLLILTDGYFFYKQFIS